MQNREGLFILQMITSPVSNPLETNTFQSIYYIQILILCKKQMHLLWGAPKI